MLILQGKNGRIIIDDPVIKEPTREDVEGVYRVLVECLIAQALREQNQETGGKKEAGERDTEPSQRITSTVPYG